MKIPKYRALGFDPFGRTDFQVLNYFGNGACARETKEEMNMIFHSSHLQRWTFDLVQNCGEIGMQFGLNGRGKKAFTVLGAEHEMDQDTGQRLGHDSWGVSRPFRPQD